MNMIHNLAPRIFARNSVDFVYPSFLCERLNWIANSWDLNPCNECRCCCHCSRNWFQAGDFNEILRLILNSVIIFFFMSWEMSTTPLRPPTFWLAIDVIRIKRAKAATENLSTTCEHTHEKRAFSLQSNTWFMLWREWNKRYVYKSEKKAKILYLKSKKTHSSNSFTWNWHEKLRKIRERPNGQENESESDHLQLTYVCLCRTIQRFRIQSGRAVWKLGHHNQWNEMVIVLLKAFSPRFVQPFGLTANVSTEIKLKSNEFFPLWNKTPQVCRREHADILRAKD